MYLPVLSLRAPFYKIMVPTVDTVRYNLLVKSLVLKHYPVLLTGPVGTGKTSVAQSILQGLDNKWKTLTINMSSQVSSLYSLCPAVYDVCADVCLCALIRPHLCLCFVYSYKLVDALKKHFKVLRLFTLFHLSFAVQTTSNNIQDIIESRIEKRTKGVYVPAGGKHLLCFLDDLNMPAHDLFGSQPPLELLRLWIDYGFWYDRKKQTLKVVKVRN